MEIRRITPTLDAQQLEVDLNVLKENALNREADKAACVDATAVIFNPELLKIVAASSDFPSVHWPLTYPKDSIHEALEAYSRGIFLAIDAPPDMPDYRGGPIGNEEHRQVYLNLYKLISDLESLSFYRGYHLSLGFATGNCRSIFCPGEECQAMIRGHPCRHPYRGRPSLEALGIDARAIAQNLNWEIKSDSPFLAGLIMVA